MSATSTALTGKDLLLLLQGMLEEDLALPIHFAHPSHDHWRSELAGEVNEVEVGNIVWSDYHEGFKTLDEDKVHEAERELRGAMEEGAESVLDAPLMYSGKPIIQALVIK